MLGLGYVHRGGLGMGGEDIALRHTVIKNRTASKQRLVEKLEPCNLFRDLQIFIAETLVSCLMGRSGGKSTVHFC